ncbi:LuxR C-terminal-related transcriptional regulator [Arsenophonus nasoniae]|uniref:Colanic acid capsular biosynthesis activation protein (LuxR-family transcriptional regulator) n=4 Tax=Arsenophonus TaxID=637 RepID=D2TYJ5_9GAMM|nr:MULTISPECIES: LuxR C-terminal-related transcriptional regulator [Arsenophonus]QBY42890.1 Transcriptional regulatory protein RcsA [Arsenophonus nasoniae]WGL99344.1 LuxR C-terminal-related transcriptional regulator [Arsenophonus sp. aPb]WGM02698.1 LuxR C-terminal-related transcriptional regulator [Arsenophonus nasoniae]WGM06948.1 LuxR C-terminal-related transcriptional regulator [Arsenophonus nasoniae]WGM11831.1 LuxR C-terminal-related transcriptional regulator [Arsenophonus nasoniae]
MKVLIIDECYYTRLGISEYLSKINKLQFISQDSIKSAINHINNFSPDVVLANLTHYCHHAEYCNQLQTFIEKLHNVRFYIYLDSPYPFTNRPILLKNQCFIMSKKILNYVLERLIETNSILKNITYLSNDNASIFSYQEQKIIKNWMNAVPNHVIARKLGISNSTVYSHKRHITEKIFVNNRIELFFVYNIFKYIYSND